MTIVIAMGFAVAPPAANATPRGTTPGAEPSVGCRTTPQAAGSSVQLFSAAGRNGDFLQTIPRVPAGTAMPVVFDLHGYLQPGLMQAAWSRMTAVGQREGFVVVTPETHLLPPKWEYGPRGADIAFLSALITHIERTLCIDSRRIYFTGLSMGAFTTSSVACHLSGRIAAVAPVAGLQDFDWCRPSRPVPVIAFHGTADQIVSYTGGIGPNGRLLPALDGSPRTLQQQLDDPTTRPRDLPSATSIPGQVAGWARRNGCMDRPNIQRTNNKASHTTFTCANRNDVELYTLHGSGHNWPGGDPALALTPITGPIATTIKASELIWEFFRKHPLPNMPTYDR